LRHDILALLSKISDNKIKIKVKVIHVQVMKANSKGNKYK